MMTFDTDNPSSCGIVETNELDIVTAFHEKVAHPPGYRANAAVYLLEPEVFDWLLNHQDATDFSTDVLPYFIGRIATWHNYGIHRDIGTLSALKLAQTDPVPTISWPDDDDKWQEAFQSSPIFKQLQDKLLRSSVQGK